MSRIITFKTDNEKHVDLEQTPCKKISKLHRQCYGNTLRGRVFIRFFTLNGSGRLFTLTNNI